ncbi:MAG: ligase-associated DNA damage response endonuclease PdeM [Rhodospirillales bacterium]|nr:ligase-associated DNA damage response endonuclease PdeM [Rhodospirillales bacterium]
MSQTSFPFSGTEVIACLSGALVLPTLGALVVADLHLEKGSRAAGRGRLLPPYDSRATLAALSDAVARHAPRCVVCLGDSFDDRAGGSRLSDADAAQLRALMAGREWVWIAGNHDPLPPAVGGDWVDELAIGPFALRHIAASGPAAGEISGHYHPKAAVVVAGRRLSMRCFVSDGRRLILPAFGAYAGGLDVFSPAFAAVMTGDFTAWLLGRAQIHACPARRLHGWPASGPPTTASPAARS